MDDGISTTPGVGRCPACEGRTATAPGPCPACGGRYRLDTFPDQPSIRLEDANPLVEAAWWALAVGSASVASVVMNTAARLVVVPIALVVPALARAARMAWRGPTYPEMDPAPYLVIAFTASYGVTLLALFATTLVVVPVVYSAPVFLDGMAPWLGGGLFLAFFLLFWPRRRKPNDAGRQPSHPPGDPEN